MMTIIEALLLPDMSVSGISHTHAHTTTHSTQQLLLHVYRWSVVCTISHIQQTQSEWLWIFL